MSINLKRIELSNIRSHKSVKFEPAGSGITALSGPNGSGKSTIVDSIAWALYGTKPQGVSKTSAIVKEGTDVTKEKAYVRLDIIVDNSDMRIERRIVSKTGSVECEVWEKSFDKKEYDSGDQKAGPSVSHAEPYIKQRLKMDEKGFLAAILVQQKQVDQLISATPKERAEVIEKLTGISSITAALGEARQQYNSFKKTLNSSNIDEKMHEKLLKEKVIAIKEQENKRKKLETLKKKIEKITEDYKNLVNKIKDYEENESRNNELKENLFKIKTELESLESESERILQLKNEKKKQLDDVDSNINFKEIEKQLEEKRTKLISVTAKIETILAVIDESANNIKILNEKIAHTQVKDENKALEQVKELNEIIISEKEELDMIRDDSISIKNSIESYKKAITIIEAGDGQCPTCLQKVHDKNQAIDSLKKDIINSLKKIDNNNKIFDNMRQKISNNEDSLSLIEDALEAINIIKGEEKRINDSKKLLSNSEDLKKVLSNEVKATEKIYNTGKHYKSIRDEYELYLKSAVRISDRVELLKDKEAHLKNDAKSIEFNEKFDIQKARTRMREIIDERGILQEQFTTIREDYIKLDSTISYLVEKIDQSSKELEAHKELLKNVETSGTTVNVLDEFREDRINNSVPLVSAYASDLLSRFTNGKFTQLTLDKKFNATVTLSNGSTRAVGLLSGGELSSAAMSLRLAISLLLNSGSENSLLVLDEVLVSMDSERSELILNTIKDVFKGQLVFISHGSNTNDIADYVVEL